MHLHLRCVVLLEPEIDQFVAHSLPSGAAEPTLLPGGAAEPPLLPGGAAEPPLLPSRPDATCLPLRSCPAGPQAAAEHRARRPQQ